MSIYTIRRRHLLSEISFRRERGNEAACIHQIRMELAALRSCRSLVSR